MDKKTKIHEALKQYKEKQIQTKIEEIAGLCKNFTKDIRIFDNYQDYIKHWSKDEEIYQDHIKNWIKNEETETSRINNGESGGSQDPGEQGSRKLDETSSTRILGFVKFYNIKAGYGFITRADNKGDVYIHYTGIAKENPDRRKKGLNKNEMVEFMLYKGKRGLRAVGVTGPNGEHVNGCSYIPDRRSIAFYKKTRYKMDKRPKPYSVRYMPKRNFSTRNQTGSDFEWATRKYM